MERNSLDIKVSERTFHFKQPAGTSRGTYLTRHSWFVSVSDGERRGIGECAPLPKLSCDDLPDYGHILRQACDALARTGRIDTERLRPYPSILFGLETALADMQGWEPQPAGSGERSAFFRGEEGIPINGLVWMGSHDEMLERIREKMAAGFRCVKLKIGAIGFDEELDLIRFIRSRFPKEEIELRVDANGAFAPDEAMDKLTALAAYGIHSIEQPIRQGQWQAMARLCRLSPLPIALDEELIGIHLADEKRRLIDTIRPAYIILKPSLHGGMAGCREWVEIARQRQVGSWMTSALESNVGLHAIALLADSLYGPHISMPQGLGTGQLFADNIGMPIEIRGDKLWRVRQT